MRKNYFLAACYLISPSVDIIEIDSHSPFGGLIGVGDSCLDSLLNKFKILRLHAILHDAAGFIKRVQSWTRLSVYITSCSNMFQLVLDWTRNRSFVLYLFGTQITNYIQSSQVLTHSFTHSYIHSIYYSLYSQSNLLFSLILLFIIST